MFPSLQDISGAPSFQGGSAGPSTSPQTTSSVFNSSGWTVNTGSGSATGVPAASNPLMIAGLIVAGLIAWKMFLKK